MSNSLTSTFFHLQHFLAPSSPLHPTLLTTFHIAHQDSTLHSLSSFRFYYARVTPRPGAPTPPGYTRPTPPRYTSLEECLQHHDPECTFLPGHMYDLTIPYFCGHKEFCRWVLRHLCRPFQSQGKMKVLDEEEKKQIMSYTTQ